MKTDYRHLSGKFWAGCLGLALLFSSCALPTNAPLKSLFYPRPLDDGSRGLIVFLQGRGGSNTDFAANGFVEAINRSRLSFDMMAPDAHMGYYMGETLVPRLKHDIIEPAQISGYRPIWLAGVSMGGLGALMYLREYPEDIAGACLVKETVAAGKIRAPIYLGYGDKDSFLPAHQLLAQILPADQVRRIPGGYDPETMVQLWNLFLDGPALHNTGR
jgi:pimeloyl-ACP methyl ester carboxylesterase